MAFYSFFPLDHFGPNFSIELDELAIYFICVNSDHFGGKKVEVNCWFVFQEKSLELKVFKIVVHRIQIGNKNSEINCVADFLIYLC